MNIKIKINKIEESEIKAYTSEDKFKKMAIENESLLKLKDHFNLEIDY